MKNIHVAIASTTSLPGQTVRNLEQISTFAARAGDLGADLLLTPELSASGYGGFSEVLATAEPAGRGPVYEKLAQTAAATGVVIAAGFVDRAENQRFIAHYVVYPDSRFVVQRKHRVTPTERPLEPVVPFVADRDGQERQPVELHFSFFEIKGVRCVISICADAGICSVNEYFAENGVELLLGPCGAGGARDQCVTTADLYTEAGCDKYLATLEKVFSPGRGAIDCIKYRRAMAAVNMCGYDGQQHYHLGHGMIINPMAEVLGFFHGLPNLDRQRPMFAAAVVDVEDSLSRR